MLSSQCCIAKGGPTAKFKFADTVQQTFVLKYPKRSHAEAPGAQRTPPYAPRHMRDIKHCLICPQRSKKFRRQRPEKIGTIL